MMVSNILREQSPQMALIQRNNVVKEVIAAVTATRMIPLSAARARICRIWRPPACNAGSLKTTKCFVRCRLHVKSSRFSLSQLSRSCTEFQRRVEINQAAKEIADYAAVDSQISRLVRQLKDATDL